MNTSGTTIHTQCIKVLKNERTYDDDEEDAFAVAKGNSYITVAGNKVVRFNGAGVVNIAPGTGAILSMDVVLDAGLAEGVYPIIINRVKLNNTANVGTPDAEGRDFASYIVVGDPKDAALALKGEIPSSVNTYLASEEGIGSLDLSAVTAFHGEFAYTVGKAVTAPSVTADVKVVAGLNGGQYGSLCSPVALPGVKCYKFTTAADGIATFTKVDDVPANEVVIIDAAVNAKVAGASLVSVANGTADAGRLYVAPDGSELRRAKNSVTVPALRGTWDIAGGSNLRIALDTPTGIKMIGTANEVFGNTYDLQGRQVENAQNGVYVVNGKKQFVKP
ncbi:MAG: hypothetical protein Q4D23_10465 [Bacteroidales bacterium]|nr:hypothetical protein [Bacteroidales bacterium]